LLNDAGMNSTDLIGSTEAARTIDVDKTTLTRWVQDGRIAAAHKLPGKNGAYLFHRGEVERVAAEYAAESEAVQS
jgi:predicted site-specific integrase-resolvase